MSKQMLKNRPFRNFSYHTSDVLSIQKIKINPFPQVKRLNRDKLFQVAYLLQNHNKQLKQHDRFTSPDPEIIRTHEKLNNEIIGLYQSTINKATHQKQIQKQRIKKIQEQNQTMKMQQQQLLNQIQEVRSKLLDAQVLEHELKTSQSFKYKNVVNAEDIISQIYNQLQQNISNNI